MAWWAWGPRWRSGSGPPPSLGKSRGRAGEQALVVEGVEGHHAVGVVGHGQQVLGDGHVARGAAAARPGREALGVVGGGEGGDRAGVGLADGVAGPGARGGRRGTTGRRQRPSRSSVRAPSAARGGGWSRPVPTLRCPACSHRCRPCSRRSFGKAGGVGTLAHPPYRCLSQRFYLRRAMDAIAEVRAFNRFYTELIGVLGPGMRDSPIH